jgi:hypothetical protein
MGLRPVPRLQETRIFAWCSEGRVGDPSYVNDNHSMTYALADWFGTETANP